MKQINKKGLYLSMPTSNEDLEVIARMYALQNPIGMIPVNISKSILEFKKAITRGAYLRLIKKDSEICGFIGGDIACIPHISETTVQQLYYYCSLKSIEAFRAVILSHEGLVDYAEKLHVKNVLSMCSPMYENANFGKILKTQGWELFGYTALWRTSNHSNPSQKPARAVL